MWITVTCKKCMSTLKYSNTSIREGHREHEDIHCPICHNVVARVFTDLNPEVYLIQPGNISNE